MQEELVSIVVPCHNEEESLPILLDELDKVCSEVVKTSGGGYSFEVILVDDGSKDGTLEEMRCQASRREARPYDLRYYSFSRNFGKEAALYAGLEHARGSLVATMDADMQDPPSLLPEMLRILEKGDYDNVATRRSTRKGEPPVRSFCAKLFYRFINRISDADIMDGARDFRLMRRGMVDAVLSMKERNRFSKGIFGWVGFKTKWLEFENVERVAGSSSWSFAQLLWYSIEGVVAFSVAPLNVASVAGVLLFVGSIVASLVIIGGKVLFGNPVPGWPSLACLILFVGGLQLLCLGVLGKYLAKDYIESKGRPLYFVRESSDDACGRKAGDRRAQ